MRKSELAKYMAKIGSKGGKTAAQRMTPEQRKERARKAALAKLQKGADNAR
jgi:hypothetical protein